MHAHLHLNGRISINRTDQHGNQQASVSMVTCSATKLNLRTEREAAFSWKDE